MTGRAGRGRRKPSFDQCPRQGQLPGSASNSQSSHDLTVKTGRSAVTQRLRKSACSAPAWPRHTVPWVEHWRSGRCEVGHVAGDRCHVVDHRGGGNQGIALGSRVEHTQGCTSLRHDGVHRQHTARRRRQHMLIQPSTEQGALLGVAAVHQWHVGSRFQDVDGRDRELIGGRTGGPRRHVPIRLAHLGLAQLQDNVGVEDRHQLGSAGRPLSKLLAGFDGQQHMRWAAAPTPSPCWDPDDMRPSVALPALCRDDDRHPLAPGSGVGNDEPRETLGETQLLRMGVDGSATLCRGWRDGPGHGLRRRQQVADDPGGEARLGHHSNGEVAALAGQAELALAASRSTRA